VSARTLSAGRSRKPDLSRLLNPAAIAVVGASTQPKSISGQPLMHMLAGGYAGAIYPVNPHRQEVQGLRSYPDVLSVPRSCDVACIAVPAQHVAGALLECGEAGIPFAVILTAGFAETGDEKGARLQGELDQAIAKSGVRVVGPNCVGVMNVATRAYSAFGGALGDPTLQAGPLAIVSQSGGFGLSIMALANAHGVGSNYVISCGNEADLTFFDFAHDFLERDEVKMIAAYMEASTEGERLRELGRHALSVGKPILMLKVGNAAAARRAASSHTGKLTADYTLFRTAFREGGYIEVDDLDVLSDVARLVIGGRYPRGRNVGVLTGSGGWGVILAEHCERNGLALPPPSETSKRKLAALNSTFASLANPIDQMANYAEQYKTIECVIDDPAFDQFIIRSSSGPDTAEWAKRLMALASRTDKPMIVNWAPVPGRDDDTRETLECAGFLCANYAARAARAAAIFTDFALKRQRFEARSGESGRPLPASALELGDAEGPLSEHVSRRCLERYGIPLTAEKLLTLDAVMALTAPPVALPVAVKLASPDIAHKTEAQAVRLNVATLEELKAAAQAVVESGLRYRPQARIEGISIQEMASGVEVILGAVNDANFGPYVMIGLGGVLTELLHDVSHRFAPVGLAEAHEMIAELRGAQLLEGYRGSPRCDVDALARALVSLSWLIADHGDRLAEVDVNPLFVRREGHGVLAADALVVCHAKAARSAIRSGAGS
jgi:acetate---CoA ligase (ADP-forming)